MADDLLAHVLEGSQAERIRDALSAEFQIREKAIKQEVFAQMRKGLDPQFAVQKWCELYAMHNLENTLTRRANKQR